MDPTPLTIVSVPSIVSLFVCLFVLSDLLAEEKARSCASELVYITLSPTKVSKSSK